jgi:hypothetical protein
MAIVASLEKQPAEVLPCTVSFAKEVGVDTISLVTITARNLVTGADSSSTLLVGPSSTVGTSVTQQIGGGADGERHRVQISIDTVAGNRYEAEFNVVIHEL